MFYSTNLSKEASTLTKWLVSIPSVAHAKGPSLINQAIYEGLREFPYFKNHQEHLTLIPHVDTTFDDEEITPRHTKSSVVALIKSLEEVSDTLILLCDTDTSSPYHYGMFKGSSTSCDDLALKLRQLAEQGALSSKLEDILKSDSALFGLGVLESKCATGAMIAVLKELSDNYVHLNLNILFVCTCESSLQHRGIKQCIPFIEQLCHQENLTLRLAVNAKPNTPVNRQDHKLHLYSGSYGKIEPSFYIIGHSATAFRPYEGFSASIIASELIRELELNPKLTQRLHHQPLVPTFDSLRVKEFGKDFSPDGMQVSFSLPLLELDLSDLLEVLKEVAATAIEHAAELVDHRESSYAQLVHEDFIPEAKDAEVISFSDLVERARHNFSGNLDKALAGMVQKCRHEGLSLHQASITIIERLNEIARLPRPSIVIYYTDNYVPPMSLEPSNSKDRELFMLLQGLLAKMQGQSPITPTLVPYYAPTDGNFLRPVGAVAAFNTLNEECPVRAQELSTLNVPTITIGIQGADLTQLTEHVTRDMCEYLPTFLLKLVELLAQPENAMGLEYHHDLEHHLAELGRRAESIAQASVREIQTINQQNASTGFYAQVNQGTLTPHSLSTFLRQFQQGEPGTLPRNEAQLSLPLNPDASQENSAEFTPETELITVTPAEVVTHPLAQPKTQPAHRAQSDAAGHELQLELKSEEEAAVGTKGNKAVRAVKSLFKKAQEAKQALEDNIQESSVEQATDAPISLVAGHHYKGTRKQDSAVANEPSAIDVALQAASAIAQMVNQDQPDPAVQEPADIDRLAPFTHGPKPTAQTKSEPKPEPATATKPEPVGAPKAETEPKPVTEPDTDESAALIVTPVASVSTPKPTPTSEPKTKQAKGKKKKKGAQRKAEETAPKRTLQAQATKPASSETVPAVTAAQRTTAPEQASDAATKSSKQPELKGAQAAAPQPSAQELDTSARTAVREAQVVEHASAQSEGAPALPEATADAATAPTAPEAALNAQPVPEPESAPHAATQDAGAAPEIRVPAPQDEHSAQAAHATTQGTEQSEFAAPTTVPTGSVGQTPEHHEEQSAPAKEAAPEAIEPTALTKHDKSDDAAAMVAAAPFAAPELKVEASTANSGKRTQDADATSETKAEASTDEVTSPVTAAQAQMVDLKENKDNLAPEDFFAALAAAPATTEAPSKAQDEASAATPAPSGFFAQALAATSSKLPESVPASGTETTPESSAETAPESVAPDTGAETVPESGTESAPANRTETASESGAETAPDSSTESAPANSAETTPESGDEVAPESDVEAAPESGTKIAPASRAETTPESGDEVAPDSGADAAAATGEVPADKNQASKSEEKRDDSNLGNDLKSAVDSLESALSSSLSKVSSFFKGKSKLKSSLNKLQEQVKETIEQEKPKAEHHILTSPEPELNLAQVTALGAQDTYGPTAPNLAENQAAPVLATAPEAAPATTPEVGPSTAPETTQLAAFTEDQASAEHAAAENQTERAASTKISPELDASLERELEALVETESAAATDAVIAALHQDDDDAKTIKVEAPAAPAFDWAKLTTAQVPAPENKPESELEPKSELDPKPEVASTSGNTIITRSPQVKPSKPLFISAKAETKAQAPTEPDTAETSLAASTAKSAQTESTSASKKDQKLPEVNADMVAQLMAEAVSKKFKEHKLAQIDTPRSYRDSNQPFADGVYANDINVDLPSTQIFDPTSDTALEADALSQELQGSGSGPLQAPDSIATSDFAPDADAAAESPQVPLTELFAQAQKELQGSAIARHLRGAHEPFAPDAPESAAIKHDEFAPDRDAAAAPQVESSADKSIAANQATEPSATPEQAAFKSAVPEQAVAKQAVPAAALKPQLKAELDAELAPDNADGPTLKRYDPAQAYAELLLDDDEQYQEQLSGASEQKAQAAAQAEAQRVSAKQQALDAATATALGDMMNDDFSTSPSPSSTATSSRRTSANQRRGTAPESLSERRAALRRAMYGDDADQMARPPITSSKPLTSNNQVAPGKAITAALKPEAATATPVQKGSYIDLNQQGKVVSYTPDELAQTIGARTQSATDVGVVGAAHAGPVGSNYDSMVQGTVQGAAATARPMGSTSARSVSTTSARAISTTSTRTTSTANARSASTDNSRPVSSVNYGSSRISTTRSTINPSTRANTPSRSTSTHSSHRFSPNSRLGILDDEPMVGNAGRNLRPSSNKSVGTVIGDPESSPAPSTTTRTNLRTGDRSSAGSTLKSPELGRATTPRSANNPSVRAGTKVETLASSNPGVRILRTTTTQPTPKAKPVQPRNEVVYSQGGAVVISQRITADQASTYLNQQHESKESPPTAPTAIAGSTASLRRTAEQSLNTSFKRLQEDKSISGTIVIRSNPNKRNK